MSMDNAWTRLRGRKYIGRHQKLSHVMIDELMTKKSILKAGAVRGAVTNTGRNGPYAMN